MTSRNRVDKQKEGMTWMVLVMATLAMLVLGVGGFFLHCGYTGKLVTLSGLLLTMGGLVLLAIGGFFDRLVEAPFDKGKEPRLGSWARKRQGTDDSFLYQGTRPMNRLLSDSRIAQGLLALGTLLQLLALGL